MKWLCYIKLLRRRKNKTTIWLFLTSVLDQMTFGQVVQRRSKTVAVEEKILRSSNVVIHCHDFSVALRKEATTEDVVHGMLFPIAVWTFALACTLESLTYVMSSCRGSLHVSGKPRAFVMERGRHGSVKGFDLTLIFVRTAFQKYRDIPIYRDDLVNWQSSGKWHIVQPMMSESTFRRPVLVVGCLTGIRAVALGRP